KQYRHDVHEHTATLRAICERERLRLALDAIVMFAHWVTPPIDTRQFDTRFFLTRVPPAQVPAHDETETTHSAWLTAAGAIREAEAGRIILPPPTWTTLRELEPFATVDEALAWARQRRVVRRQPEALERDGHRMLVLPGDPLHPQPDPDAPLETRFVLVDRRESNGLKRVLTFRDLFLFYMVTSFSLRWIATAAAAGPSALVIWVIAA